MITHIMGDYGSMTAWFIPEGIANIFSMSKLEKRYCITYDSWEGYFMVHTASREVQFYKDENGHPYINLEEFSKDIMVLLVLTASEEAGTMLVQTVRQNYEGYTKRKILHAKEARCAMGMIRNPSKKDFKNMVRENLINNYPVTSNDVTNARAIFGPDLANLRGKMVWRTPAPVVSDYVSVP
jgi:hypothetical protein